jgi:hypothetical protein
MADPVSDIIGDYRAFTAQRATGLPRAAGPNPLPR